MTLGLGHPRPEGVAKTIDQAKFGIQRKQSRQTRGRARVDPFEFAGVPPGATQADVAVVTARQRGGRRVVQEPEQPERASAEVAVVAGMENVFVPQHIGRARGHAHRLAAGTQVNRVEVAQSAHDARVVDGVDIRTAA